MKVPLLLTTDEDLAIWANAERVADRVAVMPAWKRGGLFCVRLTCCGRDDGTYGPAAWGEADVFREDYLGGPGVGSTGHQRSAIIVASTQCDPRGDHRE